jgi:isoleucyl-tRNA synthetase
VLYANIDGYNGSEEPIAHADRPEIDRWVLSRLHSLIAEVDQAYQDLEPTKAARAIQSFTIDELSNWHVRLSRRRFWKGELTADKMSAYQTLVECLKTVSILGSPIAPFYLDRLFRDLNAGLANSTETESVHLTSFPEVHEAWIDLELEARMALAQQLSSQVLSLRKREKLRVRQPLRRILVPVLNDDMARRLKAVESLILSEVNVKELQILRDGDDSDVTIVKRIKPDFKSLGPRFGKRMKSLATAVSALDADGIERLESTGSIEVEPADGLGTAEVLLTDVEISTEDIPGWLVASASGVTVALDIVLDESLRSEGIARELINRIQNMRKDTGLEVTDRIVVQLRAENDIQKAIALNMDYIRAETLADEIHWSEVDSKEEVILDDGQTIWMTLKKVNR